MGFNRIDAKFRAKAAIRQATYSPYKVSLVYLLLTSLVSQLVGLLISDPADTILYYAQWGYDVDVILNYVWTELSGQIILYAAISVLLSIYGTVMSFGYYSYTLRLSRNEEPELNRIFDGFFKWARVLWLSILKSVFAFLWGMILIVPAALLYAVGILLLELDVTAMSLLFLTMWIGGMVMIVVASYRYCLAEYFLLDAPDRTARECVTLSKNAMKGWKMERFTLDMSFIGWILLGVLLASFLSLIWTPLGIVGTLAFNAWFLPYRSTTEANFYNDVTGWKNPFQPTEENDWESRMRDLKDAFGER